MAALGSVGAHAIEFQPGAAPVGGFTANSGKHALEFLPFALPVSWVNYIYGGGVTVTARQ